jgi:hypothetical protein
LKLKISSPATPCPSTGDFKVTDVPDALEFALMKYLNDTFPTFGKDLRKLDKKAAKFAEFMRESESDEE